MYKLPYIYIYIDIIIPHQINIHMSLKIFINLLTITLLLILTTSDNILIILDNTQLLKTHSKLLTMLQSSHNV